MKIECEQNVPNTRNSIVPEYITGARKIIIIPFILAVFAAGCGSDRKSHPVSYSPAPTVSSTIPADAETDISTNSKITVTFSEEMDPDSISEATFALRRAATNVPGTVTYSGVTAVFTPDSVLSASTIYTALITTGAQNLSGDGLDADVDWNFTTGAVVDITAPLVSSTDPANSDTGVLINRNVSATFSEAMNPSTISGTSFTLKQGVTVIPGTVTFSGVTAVFNPTSNLTASTVYTATVTTGVKDLAGNAMAENRAWSFTTGATADTIPPTVSSTLPANNALNVVINGNITATFSEAMDPLKITSLTFTLMKGATAVPGGVTYSGVTAVFNPTSDLTASTVYTATITVGAKDLAGNALVANKVWVFTTGATPDTTPPTVVSTNPANMAVSVATNTNVSATFSEAMDPLKITALTFTLLNGVTPVAGAVTYSGITAVFNPTSNLAASTTYTATVTIGAKDIAGNPLAVNKVWTFTTGVAADTTPPTVTLTNPANADTNVAINKKITATFSEGMKPLTITTVEILLKGPGTTPVPGTVGYDSLSNIVTFTPDSSLAIDTTFTATITTGVRDLANNALAVNKVWTFTTGALAAQTVPQLSVPLGATSTFAILASAEITNIPTSIITGDVGLTPDTGSNISGFSVPATCPEVTGIMYAVDAAGPACAQINPTLLLDAKAAAETAFINARAAVRGTPQAISGDLNGLTLYPGLYESGTSLEISPGGHLYLDAQGDSSAIFIIRSETSITTESSSQVVLTKAAKATNVYWTAGSTITLGTTSIMKGTLIAGTAISLLTGANLEGRALNQGAAAEAITLDSATITVPSP